MGDEGTIQRDAERGGGKVFNSREKILNLFPFRPGKNERGLRAGGFKNP